ncbi:reverse transcriptase domain-containing protein [Tanacetum coccineum]
MYLAALKRNIREHEIEFKGRNSIKGQILADFLVETSPTEREEEKKGEPKRKEPEPENTWKLFTDVASSSDGSGAGLLLVNPEGKEYTYVLRFEFETTNNKAEYEALIAGLRIAKEMQIQELAVFVDSQLVPNQVKGLFEARKQTIKQYLEKTMGLLSSFPSYSIEHIKREHNKKEDALSKLASMNFLKLAMEVLVEVIQTKSVAKKITDVVKEDEDSWMVPIQEYLKEEILPKDPQKVRKLCIKSPLYRMIEERLYRRSYMSPWLRCVGPMQAKSIIKEVHEGSCGMHSGPRSVVSKITRLGYYWPSMHKDAKELIHKCEACQIYSSVPRKPKQEMTSITSAWPFSQWGIDIVGPLPTAPGGARFLVVAIDYFTKWVEAKPLISTTGRHMEKFVWEHIVCRFGRPQIIISDNGKQFAEGTFPVFCKKLRTLQAFTSVYHPQANGQVEVTNREIVKGMERRLGMAHQAWVDELPQVLWAHRTTPKSSNKETPFSLVYGSEAVIPIEISVETK